MAQAGVEFAKVSYALAGPRLNHERPGTAEGMLLHDISLRLEAGTTTALLGRSGAGKTTLLRMVNALATPTSGEILVDGQVVDCSNARSLRRSIGYVIQEAGLFPHMTVERNAGLALELAGRPKSEIVPRVAEVLELVALDLAEFRERYPWQLSGGQRQRVGLARALATDPGVLLMDEPFGALDPITRAEMQTMVRELLARVKKTVLLVTHDLDEALYLAQRVVFLADGTVVADMAASEVLESKDPHVRDYVAAVRRLGVNGPTPA
ncbi:MAG TPA: ATP-binding cassette domain-containing protein [Granulicella sp.]|jgi:osmoprotectant transport system ATP-binding protein|nr:ATP-binding cassette domain-containing protein [Granulicella sp.]